MTYREQTREFGLREWRRYPPELAKEAWECLSAEELDDLKRIIERVHRHDLDGIRRAVTDLAVTRHRQRAKARRDAETDVRARILVGARLPREKAEEVRQAAQGTGRSVYRFVADAIERELEKCMNIQGNE